MEMDTPDPTSTTPEASSLDLPPSRDLPTTNPSPLPMPPPVPTTPSFILTPLPIPTSNLRSNLPTPPPRSSPEPRRPLTPEVFRRLRPRFLQTVEDIPAVGGEVDLEEFKDKVEDGERENRIPEKEDDLLTLKLRSPTLAPTLMTQLTDHVSALCADWSAILPDTARSTCVVDASRLSLDIRLATALTNKGLGVFCAEGLIQAQTLCRTIAIMTMDHGRISPENSETLVQEYNRDAQLLFIGADLQKARFLSVEEHQVMGWQPTSDVPATPRLRTVDEMPDTPYDYDTELYGDGES
ncbi:hypothetical protein Moror_12581 [Moniliophthora roreri MCA 2997]|uniref:Reverse transcriptase-rnase h-integrase n=1 Tax=Moniliophthora roreri (strain MCA 2997) TaxID=1381753 RepID=V2YVB8_MONRO|nr:hypothetical protein Moror_12581 [Moniliophthora roreri MCA 2997]